MKNFPPSKVTLFLSGGNDFMVQSELYAKNKHMIQIGPDNCGKYTNHW